MNVPPRRIDRRTFIAQSSAVLAASTLGGRGAESTQARQAMGTKVGEVTDSTAIVWTRLTAETTRNNAGVKIIGQVEKGRPQPVTVPVAALEGACPGAMGRVRVRYGTREDLGDARATEWADVLAETDFTHHFALRELKPATRYHYAVESAEPGGEPAHGEFRGQFETAPAPSAPSELRFCVMTCQAYHDRDHEDGHNIFPSMLSLAPQFVAFTGDNVYYDSDEPRAVSPALARFHWQRMFSQPRHVELLRNVASYWQKDDHDTLSNDSWPGAKQGALSFAEGQRIFRQQAVVGERIYRTFRWGRDLQIWLTDGRDFRSPNNAPDGAEKTIWGREQKEWFKRTMAESDATWRLLISPTPLVGPDRGNKNDNHANTGFQHEGDELRAWLHANAPDNFFVICGDRHWQYHSVHPQTGVQEFAVGPASNAHASGSPGEDKTYHRFHRVKGGFLSVALRREGGESAIHFQHHDVFGKPVYALRRSRSATA